MVLDPGFPLKSPRKLFKLPIPRPYPQPIKSESPDSQEVELGHKCIFLNCPRWFQCAARTENCQGGAKTEGSLEVRSRSIRWGGQSKERGTILILSSKYTYFLGNEKIIPYRAINIGKLFWLKSPTENTQTLIVTE